MRSKIRQVIPWRADSQVLWTLRALHRAESFRSYLSNLCLLYQSLSLLYGYLCSSNLSSREVFLPRSIFPNILDAHIKYLGR